MRVVRNRMRKYQHDNGNRHPTKAEVNTILQFLRPNFDMIVSRNVTIDQSEAKLLHLTHEQYSRLDELEANRSCLFEGAAGTGKTLLAIEYARRAALKGSSVLLVCFNRLLGIWLNHSLKHENVVAGSFHSITRRLIFSSSAAREFAQCETIARNEQHSNSLFGDPYFTYCEQALEEIGAEYDVLVVDEAQDFSCPQFVEVFDQLLRGGMARGSWAIFGDFTRQAIFGHPSRFIARLGEYGEHFVSAKLTLNCRNTRRIAEETCAIAGFNRPPFKLASETGLPVEYRYVCSTTHLVESVTSVVLNLLQERVEARDIVLLSPRRFGSSGLAGLSQIGGLNLFESSTDIKAPRDTIRFSTIHAFKGLESQVVVLFDVESIDSEQTQSLLYVGMSRAKSLLILVMYEKCTAVCRKPNQKFNRR